MAGVALASVAVCLALRARWRRRPPTPEQAHPLLALLIGIALLNSALHMAFDPSPHQTTNFALIALGSGFVCLSHRWLALILLLNGACWATLAGIAPPADGWIHFSFFLLMAYVVGVTFHLVRIWNLEGLALSSLDSQRAQAALLRSEASLRSAQRLAHLGSYELDAETGTNVHWSEETYQITGLDPQSDPLTADQYRRIVHPDDRERFSRALGQARQGQEMSAFVHRILRPDGSVRYVEAFGSPVAPPGARPRWIGTLRDVTDRELSDQARTQLQEELNHAARLGTMGEMAAALAHEIHQPLAAIVNYARGCARRLEAEGEADLPAVQDALDEICMQAERSSEIVRTLWRFARKGEPEREWVNVEQVSRDVLHLVDNDVRQQEISVRVDPICAQAFVHADPIQTAQVLLNLVRNGFDAMREAGGPIRELTILAKPSDDGMMEVEVRDTGCGLTPEVLAHLFEPFTTTKPTGLGLGLSICRRIVESYGGQIGAHPNAGGGASFHFTLPGRHGEAGHVA
jgi:PAS domain S-box-containing protein